MESKLPTIILVISAPGAGKSTQCSRLAKEFGYVHLSIGEILREERSADTPEAHKLDQYMKEFEASGKLMPCDIPLKYLIRRMRANGWNKSVFLVDGFIKSVYMYHYWDQMIGDSVRVAGCLYLECSDKVLLQRLQLRAKDSHRKDDSNPELARIRLKTFQEQTLPVVTLYANSGLLYIVDAEKSIDEVFTSCKNAVQEMLSK